MNVSNLVLVVSQVPAGPLPEFTAQPHVDSAKQAEPLQSETQAKVGPTTRFLP